MRSVNMNRKFENLTELEVPSILDAKILAASRLAAHGHAKRKFLKKLWLVSGSAAAAIMIGITVFLPSGKTDANYQALSDLSSIEQEFFSLETELNCQNYYALNTAAAMEILP